jgi:hypothetical protein
MNNKKIMALLSLVCVLVLALSTPSMLVADDDDDFNHGNEGCKLQGTWFADLEDLGIPGYYGRWLMTFHEMERNKGTGEWEFILPPDYLFPEGTWSSGRGSWAKSGPVTYEFKLQTYLYDSSGQVLTIGVTTGTIILTGCASAKLIGTAKMFNPDGTVQRPPFSPPPLPMQRLLLDQSNPIL